MDLGSVEESGAVRRTRRHAGVGMPCPPMRDPVRQRAASSIRSGTPFEREPDAQADEHRAARPGEPDERVRA